MIVIAVNPRILSIRSHLVQAYIDVVNDYDMAKNGIVSSGFLTKLVSALFPNVTVRYIWITL